MQLAEGTYSASRSSQPLLAAAWSPVRRRAVWAACRSTRARWRRATSSSPSSPRVTATTSSPAAVARGAAGVVVQRATGVPAGDRAVVVEVADTLRALQVARRAVRRASAARVVAITGSAGKTTTKDAIAAVVGARYRVVKNRGNLNNHLGLPLSLLELRRGPEVAVMELGMNHAGEIRSAGRPRRAGRARLDQRRRRAHRLLRLPTRRSPTPRPRSSRGVTPGRCSSPMPTTRW